MEVIVGTAGHIDHGKTTLVKALTGVDTDRLPEEKRRGITVDLGFAEMAVGDVHFGFVDVPGHERFVKNMLAGASGIDVVMLIVEAGEGVMPQTREHFDICRLLGINSGVIVLSKIDLIDEETIELAKLDAAELVAGSFLADAPVVCVSAVTGEGIEQLKDVLAKLGTNLPSRGDQLLTRLPTDRSFTMKGFGAVVTGTLASGTIEEGAELELLPSETPVRVRGLQTHGKSVTSAAAGQRLAVNLGGVDHSQITRGMLLTEAGVLRPVQAFDAYIEVLKNAPRPVRSRQRVRVHIGTIEALARVQILNGAGEIAPGDKDLIQIRLESPVTVVPGESFIVRSYSPQFTIAGGTVLDNTPARHRRREIPAAVEFLNQLKEATGEVSKHVELLIHSAGRTGISFPELRSRTGLQKNVLARALAEITREHKIIDAYGRYIAAEVLDELAVAVRDAVAGFHKREPLAKGISREAVRKTVFAHAPDEIFRFVLSSLEASGELIADMETIRLTSHSAEMSADESVLSDNILAIYKDAGLEVPKLDEALTRVITTTRFSINEARKFLQRHMDSREIVKVSDEFYFSRNAIDTLTETLVAFAAGTSDRLIDVPKFKELAGISRKYAIPLLEYFDREHITARAGDKRVILK